MEDLKIGLQLGYWGAGPDPKLVSIAQEAEKLGYDAVFTAEAWGSDVFTPLAWIGAHTERIRLGTGIAQLSARAPTAAAMAARAFSPASRDISAIRSFRESVLSFATANQAEPWEAADSEYPTLGHVIAADGRALSRLCTRAAVAREPAARRGSAAVPQPNTTPVRVY